MCIYIYTYLNYESPIITLLPWVFTHRIPQTAQVNLTAHSLPDHGGDGMLDFFASHRVLAHQDVLKTCVR